MIECEKRNSWFPFLAVFIQNISSLQIKWGKSKGKIFHFYFQIRSDNELHLFGVLIKIWLKHTGYGHNCPQIYLFKKKWAESVLRQYVKPERHRTGPLLCQQGVGERSSLGRKSRLSQTRLGRWEICADSNPWYFVLTICQPSVFAMWQATPASWNRLCWRRQSAPAPSNLDLLHEALDPQQSNVYLSQDVTTRLIRTDHIPVSHESCGLVAAEWVHHS